MNGSEEGTARLRAALVELWSETLGRACDEDSDLLELGGDSLTVLRLLVPIGELAGGPVSFGAVLDAPTPRELAERLVADTARAGGAA